MVLKSIDLADQNIVLKHFTHQSFTFHFYCFNFEFAYIPTNFSLIIIMLYLDIRIFKSLIPYFWRFYSNLHIRWIMIKCLFHLWPITNVIYFEIRNQKIQIKLSYCPEILNFSDATQWIYFYFSHFSIGCLHFSFCTIFCSTFLPPHKFRHLRPEAQSALCFPLIFIFLP